MGKLGNFPMKGDEIEEMGLLGFFTRRSYIKSGDVHHKKDDIIHEH